MEKHCTDNSFCSLLTPAQKERLCKHCLTTTWSKKHVISYDITHKFCIFVHSGLMTCSLSTANTEPKTTYLYVKGDFLAYPLFTTDSIAPLSLQTFAITCIKECTVTLYPIDTVRQLFHENPLVCKYVLSQANNFLLRSHIYTHLVLQQDSYNALKYLLDFCTQYNVPRLTYDELSTISNMHRITVTRTMKELLRSDDFKA